MWLPTKALLCAHERGCFSDNPLLIYPFHLIVYQELPHYCVKIQFKLQHTHMATKVTNVDTNSDFDGRRRSEEVTCAWEPCVSGKHWETVATERWVTFILLSRTFSVIALTVYFESDQESVLGSQKWQTTVSRLSWSSSFQKTIFIKV